MDIVGCWLKEKEGREEGDGGRGIPLEMSISRREGLLVGDGKLKSASRPSSTSCGDAGRGIRR